MITVSIGYGDSTPALQRGLSPRGLGYVRMLMGKVMNNKLE